MFEYDYHNYRVCWFRMRLTEYLYDLQFHHINRLYSVYSMPVLFFWTRTLILI
jgi:hypothetical protein